MTWVQFQMQTVKQTGCQPICLRFSQTSNILRRKRKEEMWLDDERCFQDKKKTFTNYQQSKKELWALTQHCLHFNFKSVIWRYWSRRGSAVRNPLNAPYHGANKHLTFDVMITFSLVTITISTGMISVYMYMYVKIKCTECKCQFHFFLILIQQHLQSFSLLIIFTNLTFLCSYPHLQQRMRGARVRIRGEARRISSPNTANMPTTCDDNGNKNGYYDNYCDKNHLKDHGNIIIMMIIKLIY